MRRLLLPLLLLACADDPGVGAKPPGTDDAVTGPTDTDRAADTEPDAPAHTDPRDDTDPPADTDPGTPPRVVRFVALGDAGEGNTAQYEVADAMGAVCALRGCDFALYLGDNFYDAGVDGVDDEQFRTKFEDPYADLDFPFWVALGNHDFGEVPLLFWKTDYQVDYTQRSSKWTMPDHFYSFDQEHATFLALDTNMIMLGLAWTQDQSGWIRKEIRTARDAGQEWVVAYGHHPWRSNGEHGNAGNYEGAAFDPTGIVDGTNVREFFRQELCNKVDLYLCGHDHNRQWLDPVCGVDLIVTGAGSKTTDLVHRDHNPTTWEDDAGEGFVWIELVDGTATVAFYDRAGQLEHEGVLVK
jgi:hypothetical protein